MRPLDAPPATRRGTKLWFRGRSGYPRPTERQFASSVTYVGICRLQANGAAMARKRKLGRPVNQTGRSKGEGQYSPSLSLLHSPAWRSFSGPAIKVFLELRTRFHGANNGRLILSLEEASGFWPWEGDSAARAR